MPNFVWLITAVVFALFEAATVSLVCIWFAGGALVAWICALLGLNIYVQIALFIIVSAILLIATRPVVKKLLKKRGTETNLDRLIGKRVIISEKVDNIAGTGRCSIGGVSWSVRSVDDNVIDVGKEVTIERIEGVHLLVKE